MTSTFRNTLRKYYDRYLDYLKRRNISHFRTHGMIPWSRGYGEYRTQELGKALPRRGLPEISERIK